MITLLLGSASLILYRTPGALPITPLFGVIGVTYALTLIWALTLPFVDLPVSHPLWVLAFAVAGSAILGSLGLIAGIVADKIDQVAAFQNFFIMPLTFLSGVFYSIHSLPPFWQRVSHLNPFFYMIDGLRYGFFGIGDVAPYLSISVALLSLVAVSGTALVMLKNGYKLRY